MSGHELQPECFAFWSEKTWSRYMTLEQSNGRILLDSSGVSEILENQSKGKGRLPAWGRTTFKVNELSKLLPKIRAVQVRNKKDGSLDLVVSHAWCKTERKHILSKGFLKVDMQKGGSFKTNLPFLDEGSNIMHRHGWCDSELQASLVEQGNKLRSQLGPNAQKDSQQLTSCRKWCDLHVNCRWYSDDSKCKGKWRVFQKLVWWSRIRNQVLQGIGLHLTAGHERLQHREIGWLSRDQFH